MSQTLLVRVVNRLTVAILIGIFLLGISRCDAQILHRKKKINKSTSADNSAQPDKLLYDKAEEDIKHGRYEVGRLNMQTLINTYPDSEYLAKAKLAIADAYFKEGGTANMTQAIAGYKDFIVFFPFLPEAGYAQMQVAMAHYRQMEKPDRDRTDAHAAEDEFQTFLQKYPNDPLAPMAEQHLREVQEVLAEGEYRIGYFYYVKGDKRAAAARFISLTNRYPLYSKSDRALWMLGNLWQPTERKDFAANYYARIVRDYPLSPLVPDAKSRLTALKAPIPQPDPKALTWMTANANSPRPHTSFVKKPMTLLHSGPTGELQSASRVGVPNMEPDSDMTSALDILTGGSHPTIGGNGTAIVATVTPGGTAATPGGTDGAASATEENKSDTATPPASVSGSDTNGAVSTTDSAAKPDAASAAATTQSTDTTAPATNTTNGTATQAQSGSTNDNSGGNSDNKGKESTSKKKKGMKKLIPW